ncbi:hypothetical protein D3C72_1299420 [compost metagenome]
MGAAENPRIAVQAQCPMSVGDTAFHPLMFNVPDSLQNQRTCFAVRMLGRRRDIQYAGDQAVGAINRRCGAVKPGILIEKVLVAIDFAQRPHCQSGTDGIGATLLLAPQIARSQRNPRCLT